MTESTTKVWDKVEELSGMDEMTFAKMVSSGDMLKLCHNTDADPESPSTRFAWATEFLANLGYYRLLTGHEEGKVAADTLDDWKLWELEDSDLSAEIYGCSQKIVKDGYHVNTGVRIHVLSGWYHPKMWKNALILGKHNYDALKAVSIYKRLSSPPNFSN